MTQLSNSIGEKAKNLIILRERFPSLVPRFEIVEIRSIFLNWEDSSKKLHNLTKVFLNKELSTERYEYALNNIVSHLEANNHYIGQLVEKLNNLNFRKVSYRTSAMQEDLQSSSFAGQYITFLDQDTLPKTIRKCCKACVKSLFSPRVLVYVQTQGLKEFNQSGSVIIQEMFYGKVSGVLFTENGFNQLDFAYTTSWRNTTVEGSSTTNFTINKASRNFKEELPSNLPKTVLTIINSALLLEKQEKKPLDIEWTITTDKAALLQFRPITTHNLDYRIEWDNTNIAESYPGITLPLTYTFIRKLYSKVYPEFLKLLGKNDLELSDNAFVFENMLGYINGRVYYNINNWYKLVAFLPGYTYNKDFFEEMLMPAKKSLAQKTFKKKLSIRAKLNIGITGARFFWLLLQTNRLSNKFTKNYLARYESYKSVQWEQLTAIETLKTYSKIEKDLLQQWAVPILNDFRTMVFHGILKKIFFRKNNDDLYIQLLSGIYDHTSVEPIRELGILAQRVKEVLVNYKGDQQKTVNVILNEKQFKQTRLQIEEYLSKYGGRSPDELKLENPRLSESLFNFTSFIVSSAAGLSDNNQLSKKINTHNEKSITFSPYFIINNILRLIFRFVLYQTKSGISKRERFRFYRAQVFGIARNVYLSLGKKFVDAKLLNSKDDIFYLTTNEVQEIILGHSFENSFTAHLKERKRLFAEFYQQNLGRRAISDGLIAPMNTKQDISLSKLAKDKLTGLGVSKGIFKGRVTILKEFDPKADVKGKILVTEHTDPGWTLLFLNAAALIVERGNALSHASIVSREIGIPAVVAVENACNILRDNQEVIVNGSTGEVTVL